MAGGINSFKDKIMFEIYKENVYSGEYRVVYFSELDDHNKDKEIDRAMKGDHFFDGFIPVSYTHLTLPTICSV